jgi:methionyl-tRNA formyltransferase
MRILLMLDYWIGLQVAKYLKEENENIVGLVINPPHLQICPKEIIQVLNLPKEDIIEGPQLQTEQGIEKVRNLKPDIILAVGCGIIFRPELIAIPPKGCINFHGSLLPYNRGRHPNVWPFVEGTPAGITLHYINEGIDTGDIILQKIIPIESIDTAKTLYEKAHHEFIRIFKESWWKKIKNGEIKRIKQDEKKADYHYAKDFNKLDGIDLDKKYTGRELINLLRARTFPPYPSAHFIDQGKKVYARISLEYAEKEKVED